MEILFWILILNLKILKILNRKIGSEKLQKLIECNPKKIIEHEIDSIPIVEKIENSINEKVQLKIIGKISKTNITKLFVKLGEGN